MGKVRLKVGFKSKKQQNRLETVSKVVKKRHSADDSVDLTGSTDNDVGFTGALHDHNYSTRFTRDIITDSNYGDEESGNVSTWREGRRIVELGVLADALSACFRCGVPLQLSHAIDINTFGLSAIIKIPCSNTRCKAVNNVPTGKRHNKIWDANTKLATAMVHTGLGGRQINAVLAAVNIPPVSNTLLHARQAESGPAFEDVAEDSIQDSLNKEIQLTTEKSGNSDLTVSVDGAWQKRGSGRSFDSLSGHCSMIGNETGKVVGYSVRSKFCKTCDEATRLQRKPAVHDCRMNWTGSSKAMERDMVVEMLKSHEDAGVHIGTVVADDDTTTFNQIKKINPDISKRSDKNHVKKNIASHLYALQPKHKSLTSKVISYLQKCLNYMICQNQGNAEGICDMLKALGHHPFGNHQFCGSWCLHKSDPSKKYSALPYGRPLNDMNLQESLIALFEKYKLDSEKLSNLASTQANESFNKTVASKAPKSHFYSGSNSLNHRVAASVGQKNVGHSYLVKVHKKIGLSPGTHTTRQAILRDMQARKMKAISTTVKAKKRRLELKLRRTQSNATREIREGRTYASGVAMLVQKIPDECMEIPPPVAPPIPSPCSQLPPSVNPVFFDLESTGLARNSHITQIAGVCGEDMWSTFVIPKIPISTAAANVTGLTLKNGKLFHHGCNSVKGYR